MFQRKLSTQKVMAVLLALSTLSVPPSTNASPGDLLLEIPNPEGQNGLGASLFGDSLAPHGSNLIVGAPGANLGINPGQVYLFNGLTGDNLLNMPNPGRSSSRFGSVVASADNNILVSSLIGGLGSSTDSVRLISETGETLFSIPPPSNSFGASLASINNHLLIGEPNGAGTIHLFDETNGNPLLTIPNPQPEISTLFGTAVANAENNILVSAPGGQGHVYLIDSQTGNSILSIPNPNPGRSERFGSTITTLGQNLLVGSPPNSVWKGGAIYLFNGTTGDMLLDIYDANPGYDVAFGANVISVGSNIAVSAPGQTFGYGDLFVFDSHNGYLLQRIPNVCGTGCTITNLNNNIAIAKPSLSFGRLQTIKVFESIPFINGVLILNGPGTSYVQNFDNALGNNGNITNATLPQGWLTNNDGSSTAFITEEFPPATVTNKTYNAGLPNNHDRALTTGNISNNLQNEIQLYAQIQESETWAIRLVFDIEVWGGDASTATNPGEAAFATTIEILENDDFTTVLDLNTISTGFTLSPPNPADGTFIDGNENGHHASFDSGVHEIFLPENSTIRLAWNAQDIGDTSGYIFGLDNVLFRIVPPGDTDGNGAIDSLDIQRILSANKFNAGPSNATWLEGDFNNDDLVDSTDIQMVLGTNLFGQGPYGAIWTKTFNIPEPPSLTLLASGLLIAITCFSLKKLFAKR
jgi:hypothetical protein